MKDLPEIIQKLKELGQPKFRAKQLLQAVLKEGKKDYAAINVFPKTLQQTLDKELPILSIKPILHVVSQKKDTEKALFEISGGNKIEAVLMKYLDGRNSICISSQAGCQMGCKFCATGTMKFGRNLTYEEIFDQVLYFHLKLREKDEYVTNIIYMGMGEPFMNYENVMKAARMLNNPDFLNLGARKITISTSGVVDNINIFSEEEEQFNLAISLHSPDQSIREKIMPIAKRWNLEQLLNSINNYIEKTNRRVSYEYVMLKNINDTAEIAEKLADISNNKLIHVNIIPYNNTNIEGISGTDREKIYSFQKILQNRGINATVRTTMGDDIAAACGQLANKNNQNESK